MSFEELKGYLLDGATFVRSCKYIAEHIDAPMVISMVMGCFSVVAAFDYLNNNKIGLGKKFVEAWEAIPPLMLSMVGITCLTPVFRIMLTPLLAPVFEMLASHKVMFAGTLLDVAMGGYQLSIKLAPENFPLAMYSSVILGTMLGCSLVFNVPVGLSIIDRKHHIYYAYGTLIGLLTIPFGCIAGGAAMALTPHTLSIIEVVKNLIPVVLITVVIAICLYFFPFATLHGFLHFSKAITFLMTFGTILAVFQFMTHLRFPLWSTMVDDGGENLLLATLLTVGQIAMVLTGALPMIHTLTKVTGPLLARIGRKVGLTKVDVSGMVALMATALPMYSMYGEMSPKGMLMNAAFGVGASWALGDHLSYLGSVQSDMIVPMVIGKLVAGVVGILLCAICGDFFVTKGMEARKKAGAESEPEMEEPTV
jgi:ethanolamine transporter